MALGAITVQPVLAQDADEGIIEEVIVTGVRTPQGNFRTIF